MPAFLQSSTSSPLLPNEVIVRSSGGDDGPAIRAAIAAASEGTTIIFPDALYYIDTTDDDGFGITVSKDNIHLRGRAGLGYQHTASPTGWGVTAFKARFGGSGDGTAVIQWRSPDDPEDGPMTQSVVGGSLRNIFVDANVNADVCLMVRASEYLVVEDCHFVNPAVTAFEVGYLPHTTGASDGKNVVRGLSAHRFNIFGHGTGPALYLHGNPGSGYGGENPYRIVMSQFAINYDDQQGIKIVSCDDIWLDEFTSISASSATNAYSLDIQCGVSSGFTLGIVVSRAMLLQSPKGAIVRTSGTSRAPHKVLFMGLGTVDAASGITVEPGAQVSIIDDSGRVTTRPDLRRAMPPLTDDFMSGGLTTPIGDLGWTLGAGTVTDQDGVADHPGIKRLSTGASAGTLAYLRLSSGKPVLPASAWELRFILALVQAGTDTDVMVRVGLCDDPSSDPPATGIWFEKLYADSGWWAVARTSGTQYRPAAASASIGSAGAWQRLRIRNFDGKAAFKVGNESNDLSDNVFNTNYPTAALVPFIQVKNQSASSKSIDLDAFQLHIIGLSRGI